MENTSSKRAPAMLLYAVLLVGILLFQISNGRWIVPLATWLFPVFMVYFLRNSKNFLNVLLCWLLYTGAFMIAWKGLVPAPGVLYYIITGGVALIFFLPFILDKFFAGKIKGFSSTLVLPLSYVAIEYVVSLLNPYGTWTFLGYTQFGNLPLMQVVSITGIYGITFLILWFGTVLNWMLENNFFWEVIHKGVKIFAAVITLVLLFGGVSLMFFSPQSEVVKVAGVQSDLPLQFHEKYKNEMEALAEPGVGHSIAQWDFAIQKDKLVIDDLLQKTVKAAQDGAKIVSWAEATVKVYKDEVPGFLDKGKAVAKEENIYLFLAYANMLSTDEKKLPEQRLIENTVTVISPSGEVLTTYVKATPVPGWEAAVSLKGDGALKFVDTPFGRLSPIICFENDFPAFNRKAGGANVDIVFSPSGDWVEIDPYHTIMRAFRAIENGYSSVNVVANGLSAVYDYQGRTLAAMDYFKTKDKVFTAYVPTEGVTTIYSKVGDLFSILCIVGFGALVAAGFRLKKAGK